MARSAESGILKVKIRGYTMLFEPAEEGGYVVTCPALPGLVTEGETLERARTMAEDAVTVYCKSLGDDNLPLPEDIELNAWQVAEVEKGLHEADSGDFASGREVKKFVQRWRRRAQ